MDKATNQKLLYRAENFPIFQNRMYATAAEAINCPKGNIELVHNKETGLIYNRAFDPRLMEYDRNYQNEQAVSEAFRTHLQSVLGIIKHSMGNGTIVEVGCGKGFFLEMLLAEGMNIRGFDPTYEGNNRNIRKRYYDADTSLFADGIVLRHVLEHIQDPFNFLTSLQASNGGKGLIYIEVPCFDWIQSNDAWFDVFYEHVNYFRLADFHRIFQDIKCSGRLFGGQYLYVIAELASLIPPVADPADAAHLHADFGKNLALAENARKNSKAAIWGGASKGVIFALLSERAGIPIDMVIDVNPAKQGLYLAGTGLQVKAPADALPELPKGSTIFVMNSNYLSEIKDMSNHAYHYVGVDHD